MDARALALALPLTARVLASIPARGPPAPPPDTNPASPGSGGEEVSRACSLRACASSPVRELLRVYLPVGAAAEARGRTLATPRDLGFYSSSLDLSPVTAAAGSPGSSADGLASILAFPTSSPSSSGARTAWLAAAQDAGIQGGQGCLRRGVVCRAFGLGTASPAPAHRPRPMLPSTSRIGVPRMFGSAPRHACVSRCTTLPSQSNLGGITDQKKKEGNSDWDIHIGIGCVLTVARIAIYVGRKLKVAEFLSHKIKLPEKVAATIAVSIVLGKSIYTLLKETKEFSEFLLYFLKLYKGRFGDATVPLSDATEDNNSATLGSSSDAIVPVSDATENNNSGTMGSSDATVSLSDATGNNNGANMGSSHATVPLETKHDM